VASPVNSSSDKVFAGTRLAGKQDGNIHCGRIDDLSYNRVHRETDGDNSLKVDRHPDFFNVRRALIAAHSYWKVVLDQTQQVFYVAGRICDVDVDGVALRSFERFTGTQGNNPAVRGPRG
jgi:hypothetical protein